MRTTLSKILKPGGGNLAEVIANFFSPGFNVHDDKEPPPENIHEEEAPLQDSCFKDRQSWGWDSIDCYLLSSPRQRCMHTRITSLFVALFFQKPSVTFSSLFHDWDSGQCVSTWMMPLWLLVNQTWFGMSTFGSSAFLPLWQLFQDPAEMTFEVLIIPSINKWTMAIQI